MLHITSCVLLAQDLTRGSTPDPQAAAAAAPVLPGRMPYRAIFILAGIGALEPVYLTGVGTNVKGCDGVNCTGQGTGVHIALQDAAK